MNNISLKRFTFIAGYNKTIGLLMLLLLVNFKLTAQGKPASAYQVKAAYLYNFTRFVEWPEDAFDSAEAPFIIGVIGNNLMADYLEELVKGEKIRDRDILVRNYKNVAEVHQCNILFISSGDASKTKRTLNTLNHQSILTVSDDTHFLNWGGMIRFYTEANKIRIEINTTPVKASQLQISSKLLSIAKIF